MENICKDVEEQMPELLAGILSAERADELQRHIGQCSACGAYLQALQADDQLLSDFADAMQPTVARLENNVISSLNRAKSNKVVSFVPIWKTVVKSRITRFAAGAAAVILMSVIGLWVERGMTSKVYGMNDVASVLRKARTIHIRSWFNAREPADPCGEPDLDDWIDLEKGRHRKTIFFFGSGGSGKTSDKRPFEHVFDGKYRMEINHISRTVTYCRLSNSQQRVVVRKEFELALERVLLEPDDIGHFEKIGQEKIDGVNYDIWESRDAYTNGGPETKFTYLFWVSPGSGQLKRTQSWLNSARTEGKWTLEYEVKIDLNADPPGGTFDTVPPEGYRERNTKETAKTSPLRTLALRRDQEEVGAIAIIMALPNRAIVMAWHTEEVAPGSPQAESFKALVPGEQLPRTSVEIKYCLWSRKNVPLVTYTGRHLACTEKNDVFYEWAIYVPNREVRSRIGVRQGRVSTGWYPENGQEGKDHLPRNIVVTLTVEEDEFDEWVCGTMAELSDEGVAPEHVTYENVLRLSEQIRASIEK
jgi:hypothetical protein